MVAPLASPSSCNVKRHIPSSQEYQPTLGMVLYKLCTQCAIHPPCAIKAGRMLPQKRHKRERQPCKTRLGQVVLSDDCCCIGVTHPPPCAGMAQLRKNNIPDRDPTLRRAWPCVCAAQGRRALGFRAHCSNTSNPSARGAVPSYALSQAAPALQKHDPCPPPLPAPRPVMRHS